MMEILLDIHLRINIRINEDWSLSLVFDWTFTIIYKYMEVLYNDEPGDLPSGKLTKLSNIIILIGKSMN